MVDPSILGIKWKTQLWHRWKALRNIPFRKKWFVGYDLEGNSYWEHIDHNNPTRLRRKVSLDRPYFHFSDFKPHPMWMQWMQFTRPTPPSLMDLRADAQRQMQLRQLAQESDNRWKSIPLKSASSQNHPQDPRIESSWSGAAADHTKPGKTEPEVTQDQTSPVSNVQMAMENARARSQNEPQVVRDELGQARIHRKKEPSSKADEPESAAFQPKQRN